MESAFASIPEELDFIHKLPKIGGWATLVGLQEGLGRSSHILPNFCDKLGLRQLDIIWLENEQMGHSTRDKWTKFISKSIKQIHILREMA